MSTLAKRLKAALARSPGVTQADLARVCKIKSASVSNWATGKTASLKIETARRAAGLLRCDPFWLATGAGSPNWLNEQHAAEGVASYSVAHDLSQAKSIVLPLQLEWDTIMQGSLPDQFVLPLRDTALQPKFASATRIIFAAAREPQPGDVVLLRDKSGDLYIREYHLVRTGHWRAAAVNPAFQPLDSAADGLQVLAVAIGALWA